MITETYDLDYILKVAQEAARLAGKVIREASQNESTSVKETKSNPVDLVTETDLRCEELITELLKNNFPYHKIIGEETSGSDRYSLSDDPTWTVDPIDGTTNFVHRLKLSCVLLSWIVEKDVKVAVTYDPYTDELFYAVKGRGSFLQTHNGTKETKIKVSTANSVRQAVISMDPGYGREKESATKFCNLQAEILALSVRNIRVFGVTGLNMAYVACGRLDAAFELGSWDVGVGPKIWDFSPGKLLIEEAGGITRDIEADNLLLESNRGLDVMKRSFFCAATTELGNELLEVIARSSI
jgi:inositol-phosphate phosphatase/L-galactose 1-phosphate phosphatase